MKRLYSCVRALSLVSLLSFSGCSSKETNPEEILYQSLQKRYEFTNFGSMPTLNTAGQHSQIAVADFDGDGRPDIVLYDTMNDRLDFYKNNMPQQGTNVLERVSDVKRP